jgi:hypothetical protein
MFFLWRENKHNCFEGDAPSRKSGCKTIETSFAVLKGQCHEIFCMQFFSSKHVSRPPDSYPKAVSNINSNSPRYSNSKLIPHCGPPPPRIRSYGVVPPAGSNPMMWPPPRARILRCGPSRRIESYGVAPPAGSNLKVWPLPQDLLSWD